MNADRNVAVADRRADLAGALAIIYQGLAEALAWPPAEWLAARGREWPLWQPLVVVASSSGDPVWQDAVLKLADVPQAGLQTRRRELERIYWPKEKPPLRLYACQVLDGRFPGPTTFIIKRLYEKVGLEVAGAEMPDYIAVELAFLAWVCDQESNDVAGTDEWRAVRRSFLVKHASQWMPKVAWALQDSAYPAWAAIGVVLAASLKAHRLLKPVRASGAAVRRAVPYIPVVEDCTLCGFCVQVCPTKALHIHEDDIHTELWLQPQKCVACHKCEEVCDPGALTLASSASEKKVLLRVSDRARCPRCGAPTVSQAELSAVAAMLGEHPAWLDTCLNCR